MPFSIYVDRNIKYSTINQAKFLQASANMRLTCQPAMHLRGRAMTLIGH